MFLQLRLRGAGVSCHLLARPHIATPKNGTPPPGGISCLHPDQEGSWNHEQALKTSRGCERILTPQLTHLDLPI